MTHIETNDTSLKRVLIAALLVALAGLLIAVTAAQAGDLSRLDRKVQVMERVLDEVLEQSEHIAVQHGGSTRGLVLDGFGALFLAEGSVGHGAFGFPNWGLLEGEEANLFFQNEDEHGRSGDRSPRIPEDLTRLKQAQKTAEQKRQVNLLKVQEELAEALIDYGATLGELPPDQWVAVALFLDERILLGAGRGGTRLLIKVKMSDLKSYAAGSLSREAVTKKVVVEGA